MSIIPLALVTYLVITTAGYLINKHTRLPWMFSVVILGMVLSATGLFQGAMATESFATLSRLGMLFFLLTIGFDLDLHQIRRLGRYVAGGDLLLTLTEGVLLALFFYLVVPEFVSHSFLVALLTGVAFGTVGEVVLLAILKEFKMEGTRFGQLALGIGVFDDVFEILVLAAVVALPAVAQGDGGGSAWATSLSMVATLAVLAGAVWLAGRVGPSARRYLLRFQDSTFVVPFFILAVIFGFIALGSATLENLGVVAAVFGGVAVRLLLPEPLFQQYKRPVFFVANIFLGPFFFLSLGSKMSLSALVGYPLIILGVLAITLTTRLSISYLLFHRMLGKRESLVMGVGLTSKFSTSVITENLLFSSGLIAAPLYTALMGAFLILKPLIVGVFSRGVASLAEGQPAPTAPQPQSVPARVDIQEV